MSYIYSIQLIKFLRKHATYKFTLGSQHTEFTLDIVDYTNFAISCNIKKHQTIFISAQIINHKYSMKLARHDREFTKTKNTKTCQLGELISFDSVNNVNEGYLVDGKITIEIKVDFRNVTGNLYKQFLSMKSKCICRFIDYFNKNKLDKNIITRQGNDWQSVSEIIFHSMPYHHVDHKDIIHMIENGFGIQYNFVKRNYCSYYNYHQISKILPLDPNVDFRQYINLCGQKGIWWYRDNSEFLLESWIDIMNTFIKNGADVTKRDLQGNTLLDLVIPRGCKCILNLYKHCYCDFQKSIQYGEYENLFKLIKTLIEMGVECTIHDNFVTLFKKKHLQITLYNLCLPLITKRKEDYKYLPQDIIDDII